MSYWEDRQLALYKAEEMQVNHYYYKLEKAFNQTKRELQKTVESFYFRYAEENGLSYAAAQMQLDKTELGELNDFIDLSMKNIGKYNQEVNNLSIKARITRYQALEAQVDASLRQLYAVQYEHGAIATMKDVYGASYYRTWYNADQYRGFHAAFAQVDPRTVEKLLEYPFNGANFSSRLWKQKDHLQTQLMESLTTMMVQGKDPKALVNDFAKKMNSKKFEAYRLLHTESSFLINEATHAAYKEDGVEKYQILATLDSKTCGICGALDGEVYEAEKAVVGENMPPFHCFCRCTDVPYYDDMDLTDETRAARDPETGKSYEVPADMSYKEWHEKYIESNPVKALAEKKLRDTAADDKQYNGYKELLGKDYVPGTLKDFQNIKYGAGDEYNILKAQAKGMSYYSKASGNEPAVTAKIKDIATQAGMDVSGLEHRIKAKDSYLTKIRRKYDPGGNTYEVRDILRYTYTANPDTMVDKALTSIEMYKNAGYNVVEINNYWLDDINPYNGINATLRSPTGQAFELQFHTPESFEVKNGEMHKLYEKYRVLPDDTEEKIDLLDQMMDLADGMTIPNDIGGIR
ncbi:MAG: minor capsid protein [Lachnospiraceae bacterium]